jgi:hypothetical protein
MPKIFNRGIVAASEDGGVRENNALGNLTRNYPQVVLSKAAVAKTSDYTIVKADADTIFTNTGASGTVVFTLPSVKVSHGVVFRFHAFAAQIIRALPVTGEAINLNGSAVVTKYLNLAAVIGNYMDLYCDGTQWLVTGFSGVVTKEA